MAKCMCKGCNSSGEIRVDIDKRGGRNGFMCRFHAFYMMGYNDENNFRLGEMKKHGFTFSFEHETAFSSIKARGEMLDFGFIPTSDCTVNVEYKSPIYQGLNAVSKQLVSIEKLIDNNEMNLDSDCGTHFHVGHVEHINPQTMEYIRRFYHSLFIPLCDVMKANPEKTKRMFGRGFTYYASPIDRNTSATAHENFINLQHDYTIEFRLCKFRTAAQYMNVIKFSRDIVNTIINNFILHFNDTKIDSRRYSNMTEYRKHKAQVAAAKIVKLFEEYSANI